MIMKYLVNCLSEVGYDEHGLERKKGCRPPDAAVRELARASKREVDAAGEQPAKDGEHGCDHRDLEHARHRAVTPGRRDDSADDRGDHPQPERDGEVETCDEVGREEHRSAGNEEPGGEECSAGRDETCSKVPDV